jgi:hypothetical protein
MTLTEGKQLCYVPGNNVVENRLLGGPVDPSKYNAGKADRGPDPTPATTQVTVCQINPHGLHKTGSRHTLFSG